MRSKPSQKEDQQDELAHVSKQLLGWFSEVKRDLPWRNQANPYATWVSEIMLQQTRVDQALPYFERFMRLFPTVQALAEASQQDLMKAWEGLGYYSRARNLQAAAKQVVQQYGPNQFPSTYDEWIQLKGVGPYTAAAISSICFNEPVAAVDGNVIRVISRFFRLQEDVTKSQTQRAIKALAQQLLDSAQPGAFNEAMMELGATVCTPRKPNCGQCPIQAQCLLAHSVETEQIPYKPKKKKVPHKVIAVGVMRREDGKILIAQRPEQGLLGGLWEFPGGKKEANESIEEALVREFMEELAVNIDDLEYLMQVDHAYSHFKVSLHVYHCRLVEGEAKPLASQQIKWVALKELEAYPFPKANKVIIQQLLKDAEENA